MFAIIIHNVSEGPCGRSLAAQAGWPTAHAMCLTVQRQHSLDTMQDCVVEMFTDVPNNGKDPFSTYRSDLGPAPHPPIIQGEASALHDGFEYNSTYSMLPITITLTKEGYSNIAMVVQAVFR